MPSSRNSANNPSRGVVTVRRKEYTYHYNPKDRKIQFWPGPAPATT